MKYISTLKLDQIPGRPLVASDTFAFRCHAGLACFTQCCRNLNLFLYPYDVLRLKQNLGIESDRFIDQHVDVVLRDGHHFPEVLLRMAENDQRTCPFLDGEGCRVYPDRPHTCRTFPVEQGVMFDAATGGSTPVSFFRPPDFCLGQHESQQWTVTAWNRDQEAQRHHTINLRWAEVRRLFENDPWGAEGPQGAKARMAFMAAYNLDRFREFVFDSSFLKRYHIQSALVKKMKKGDEALLTFGFEWIRYFIWGISSPQIRPRR
jgi:Fe-S-cluster containining protein